MKKRLVLGAMTLLSVVTLAACAKGASEETKLVTMKGDTITVSDFYKEIKHSSTAQQTMLTLILSRVFEEQYGDKVTDEQVSDAYNKTAEQYGENFANALAGVGLTTETYKQELRKNLLLETAVEETAKKELNDEAYQKAFESYTPEITAQVILLASEEDANAVLGEVRAEGADFAAIAKEKTKGSETEYKFDSAENNLPAEVRAAAAKLDINAISEVVKVTNQQGAVGYYIIKTTAKTEKGADWKTYKDRLEKLLLAEKKADSNFQRQVVAAALEKANVKIKDDAFANILAVYATQDEVASSSSSEAPAESSTEASSSEEKSE